jgi:hypothetical protein
LLRPLGFLESVKRNVVLDRLLTGENPHSVQLVDADYWVGIYREMVGFKKRLLEAVKTDLQTVSPVAQVDLGDDVVLIEAQLARYERRLTFWSDRATLLRPPLVTTPEPE